MPAMVMSSIPLAFDGYNQSVSDAAHATVGTESDHHRNLVFLPGSPRPLWVRCDCGNFWCTKHQTHAHDCDCPSVDEMDFDPYSVIPFDTTQLTSPDNRSKPRAGDPSHPLSATGHTPAIAFSIRGREGGAQAEVSGDVTDTIRGASGGSSRPYVATTQVRRLTPRECERLQGLPDDHTRIPWRDKPADQCPDGPRYRAIGNGFAVPVVAWIGRRIQMVEEKA